MYSIKQNQLIMGALPLADVTVHYMDIRAAGKRYDEFYEQAKTWAPPTSRAASPRSPRSPTATWSCATRTSRTAGAIVEAEYDLVVLAVGVQPNREVERLFAGDGALGLDDYHYVAEPDEDLEPRAAPTSPASSSPERRRAPRTSPTRSCTPAPPSPRSRPISKRLEPQAHQDQSEGAGMSESQPGMRRRRDPDPRAASASTSATAAATSPTTSTSRQGRRAVKDEPGVVVAKHTMFACSDATQQEMEHDIEEQNLDGLVVASCSPKLHVVTFRGVAKRAGLNPYEYNQANIREQCSWTHTDDHEGATEQGDRPGPGGIARTRLTEPARAARRRDDARRRSSSAAASPVCAPRSAWPTSASASSSSSASRARRLGRHVRARCSRTTKTAAS
jgi:hypothetical protein